VGRTRAWGLRGIVACAAVIALHAGLVLTLVVALRTSTNPATDFVGTLIFLSSSAPALPLSAPPRPRTQTKSSPLAALERPASPPPRASLEPDQGPSIDWGEEAQRAAAAVTSPRSRRELDRASGARSAQAVPQRAAPKHVYGEQYRPGDGSTMVWISDRCFIISELAPLGGPDVIARSIPTRTVCQDDSAPAGELFKDLAAYKKYHPQW
jgi:hypothetical protein